MALPYCFEHQYGGADAYVQRVDAAEHGNADVGVGSLSPKVSQSVVLGAHDDGRSTRHVGVVVKVGVLQLRGENLNAARFQKADTLVGRAGHARHGESGADGRTNEIRVIQVGQRVAHHDGVNARRIGRTQDGAQIAGFLDALEHDNQRTFAKLQVVEP